MGIKQLVNLPAPTRSDAVLSAQSTPPSPSGGSGVFITPQSLTTFPVASTLVTVVWKVLGQINASWADSKAVPLIIAILIGLLVYSLSEGKGETTKGKVIGFLIAILNSFMLAAAALGIDTVTSPPPAGAG